MNVYPACKNCHWWKHDEKMDFTSRNGALTRAGYCKRTPPQFFIDDDDAVRSRNVSTVEHDYCGEFETPEEYRVRRQQRSIVTATGSVAASPVDTPVQERRKSGQERLYEYLKGRGMSALDFAAEVAANEHPALPAAKQRNVENWLSGIKPESETRDLLQSIASIPADSWVDSEQGRKLMEGRGAP